MSAISNYQPALGTHVLDSAPLLSNILPHLQALLVFITNTLPKPVLVALLYRLVVLHFASQILPTIGADSWEADVGDERPVSAKFVIIKSIELNGSEHIRHRSLHT